MKNKITKYDILLIAFIVLINITIMYYTSESIVNSDRYEAFIYSNNELYEKYILDDGLKVEFTIKTQNGYNTICIEGKNIYIMEADCADKLCIKQGKIKRSGQLIVCIPNKLVIKIMGNENVNIDSISQ